MLYVYCIAYHGVTRPLSVTRDLIQAPSHLFLARILTAAHICLQSMQYIAVLGVMQFVTYGVMELDF